MCPRGRPRGQGRPGGLHLWCLHLIMMIEFNPHPGHVVASLDKTLYDNYLCLVASNKQQIYVGRSQNANRKARKMVNS